MELIRDTAALRALLLTLLTGLSACGPEVVTGPQPRTRRPEDGDCLRFGRTVVDFGEIKVGTRAISHVSVFNRMSFEVSLTVVAPTPFSVNEPKVTLQPGEGFQLRVEAAPTDGEFHRGFLVAGDPGVRGGCEGSIPLNVLGGGLLLFPETIDFGLMDPGQRSQRSLRFTNTARQEAVLTDFELSGGAFSGLPAGVVRVPAMGFVDVPLWAQAPALGSFTGFLHFRVPEGQRTVTLGGVGGHPVARYGAEQVDFQQVGLFPSGPSFGDRQLELRNAGLSNEDRNTQLRLMPPFHSIEAVEGDAAELELDVSSAVLPLAMNEASMIGLHFVPRRLGARHWRVTLYTNDPLQPEQVIDVYAEVVSPPPCALELTPREGLSLVQVGAVARGAFTFTNPGGAECILDDVRLDESSAPGVFTLEEGEVTQVVLPPGGTHRVVVVASASGRGELRFHVVRQGEGVFRVPFVAAITSP